MRNFHHRRARDSPVGSVYHLFPKPSSATSGTTSVYIALFTIASVDHLSSLEHIRYTEVDSLFRLDSHVIARVD
jgi:hypothetical protein